MILESVKDTEDIHSLLTMIQEENTLAFNMFYEMYYDQVFRYTYYFLKDTESCREVVADVFFAVWQSRKRLKDIENLEAYLFISVRNEVTRYNKKNGRQNRVSLDELPVQLEITEEESPYDKISYKEMEQLLGKIIGELPEKCRLIFLMARQGQFKTQRNSRETLHFGKHGARTNENCYRKDYQANKTLLSGLDSFSIMVFLFLFY